MADAEIPDAAVTRVLHALTNRLHESLCNCKAYPDTCVSKAQYRRDELVHTLTYAEDALAVAIEQGWTPPAPSSEDTPARASARASAWPAVDDRVEWNPGGEEPLPGTVTSVAGPTAVVAWDQGDEFRVYTHHLRPLSEVPASPATGGAQ